MSFFLCACLCVGEAEQTKLVSSLIVFTVSSTQSVISTQTAICPNNQLNNFCPAYFHWYHSIHPSQTLSYLLTLLSICLSVSVTIPSSRSFLVPLPCCCCCFIIPSVCLLFLISNLYQSSIWIKERENFIQNIKSSLIDWSFPDRWSVCSTDSFLNRLFSVCGCRLTAKLKSEENLIYIQA